MLKGFFIRKNVKIIILTAVLLIAIIFAVIFRNSIMNLKQGETVTRAQWLTMLTDTMGYNKSNGAKAYFTDVSPENTYYDSIQIAVAYNLITANSDNFYPDNKATREFVATTTAKAVGFIGAPNAILNDISGLPDLDHIRLAVDNEIFTCPDGNFNPNGEVSLAECDEIIGKIKDIITITIDPNHVDTVTYNKSLVDLSESANIITYNDSAAMSVIISGSDALTLEKGSVYLLPPSNEYPYGVARKVKSVTRNGYDYAIENEEPEIWEVLEKIDIQGEYYPDYSKVIWEDGVTGEFVPDNLITQTALWSDINIQPLSIQPLNYPIAPMAKVDNTLSGSLNCEFNYGINKNVKLSGLMQSRLKVKLKMDADFVSGNIKDASLVVEESHGLSVSIKHVGEATYPLYRVPIPVGTSGVSVIIKVSLNASGEFVMSLSDEITSGFGFTVTDNRPSVREEIYDHTRQIEVTANAQVGFEFKPVLNIVGLDVADVAANIGVGVDAARILPQNCVGIDIYMPLFIRASLFPGFEAVKFFAQLDIWTAETSPVRSNLHYEDGNFVDDCTRMGVASPNSETILPSDKVAQQEVVDKLKNALTMHDIDTARNVMESTEFAEIIKTVTSTAEQTISGDYIWYADDVAKDYYFISKGENDSTQEKSYFVSLVKSYDDSGTVATGTVQAVYYYNGSKEFDNQIAFTFYYGEMSHLSFLYSESYSCYIPHDKTSWTEWEHDIHPNSFGATEPTLWP